MNSILAVTAENCNAHQEYVCLHCTDDVADIKLRAPGTTQDREGPHQQSISSSPAWQQYSSTAAGAEHQLARLLAPKGRQRWSCMAAKQQQGISL
jgi:hypothetical protein